jgi:uncharacterized protein YggE
MRSIILCRSSFKAGFCALGLCLILSGFAQAESDQRFIEVSGVGEVTAQPDRVRVNFGIQTSASDLQGAEKDNTRHTLAFLDVLNKNNISSKDVQASYVNLAPRYEDQAGVRKLAEYEATKTISVLLTDPTTYGEILREGLKAGVNSVGGMHFETSRQKTLEEEARKEAALDAHRKAEVIAETLGVKLGGPISVVESGFERPRPLFKSALAGATMGEPVDVLSLGEIKITGTLDIKFAIVQ